MKQCPYCNDQIDDRSKFCPICGKELDNIQKSEETLMKIVSVEQRRCPICDELIDSNVSICPICNEQTHFQPEKIDIDPLDGNNEDNKPNESQVNTELSIAEPPQVPDSPKRIEDVEKTVEIPLPLDEDVAQTDIQPSETEEKKTEYQPNDSVSNTILPPVPPKEYFEKMKEEEEKKKEKEKTHLDDQKTIQRITNENNSLSAEIKRKEKEIQQLKDNVGAAKTQIEELEKERDSMHQYIQYLSNNYDYNQVDRINFHWIYGVIIALLIFGGTLIVLFYGSSLQLKKYKDAYYLENYAQAETKTQDISKVKDKMINMPKLGTYTYTGDVNEDEMPDGEGEAVFGNGDTFVGKFDDGNFSYGRYTWKEDGAYFEGKFVDNEPLESSGAYYDKKGNMRTN